MLAACWVAFFWVQSSRAILYSAMPAISLETGLDPRDVGSITDTLYGGYTIAVYVSGVLPISRRVAIAGGALLTSMTNVAFAGVTSMSAMLVIAFFGGAGVGLYLPRGTAAIADAFRPEERARALGWHELAAGAGLTAAPLFMGAVLLVAPWRVAVVIWSAVGLATAAAAWRWVPDAAALPLTAARGRPWLDVRVLTLACMGGACFAIIGGFFTMLPTIVATGWGASPSAATRWCSPPSSGSGSWTTGSPSGRW